MNTLFVFNFQDESNILFARAMYASDCPLAVFQNEYWKEFFHKIRPCWEIPSNYLLSNSLLDSEFERIQLDVHEKIGAANVLGLQCDGWSNRR